jgi:hypothetical protein
MEPEELTIAEFERVLHSERFATIHDLVNAEAFRELTEGSHATEAAHASDAAGLPDLPARR